MKFGQQLPRNQVPEWASSYINYKALKKLIKTAGEVVKNGEPVDTAEFFYFLDRNLEDVDAFYNKKFGDVVRRLKLLEEQYGQATQDEDYRFDKDELEGLIGALLELRGSLRQLQWYGEVNRRGFVKITKKLDKKIPHVAVQRRYLQTMVDLKPFATSVGILETTTAINDWLAVLGNAKYFDDASSTNSSSHHGSARTTLNLSQALLDSIEQAIRNDKADELAKLLCQDRPEEDDDREAIYQGWYLSLLQRSVSCRSKACISVLLEMLKSLDDVDDINKRNCIHRLVISIGRAQPVDAALKSDDNSLTNMVKTTNYITPAVPPVKQPLSHPSKEIDGVSGVGKMDKYVSLLQHLLGAVKPEQRSALQMRDTYGRMPIHYAAQYGLVLILKAIVQHMQIWDQYHVFEGIDSPYWEDTEGFAPLHLAVIGGHLLTTQTLIKSVAYGNQQDLDEPTLCKHTDKTGEVLALATKSNYGPIVKLLVSAGIDVNYQDRQGETALHVAARFGHVECGIALLDGNNESQADAEMKEKTFGWTPLFIACVDGHLPIVELLVQRKAILGRLDDSGWTAMEHAALRGHMDIARFLAEHTPKPVGNCSLSANGTTPSSHSSSPPPSSLHERKSLANANANGTVKMTEPVKTFGHRYLHPQESLILVSLGTMDTRKALDPVNLSRIPLSDAHHTQLDTALSVVVSAGDATGEPSIIDLPVQDNISTDPIMFTAADPTQVKLYFDLIPTYAGATNKFVGRAVALLSTVKPHIGNKRISLQGDVTVPIVSSHSLEVIGSVSFNFLTITPFTHPNMSINENQTYWRRRGSTMVIGHRGLGKNVAPRTSLQLGENTIQSFIAAANLGASYVEFDVQLTKDHVPVIYHDFLVSETGIDAPVHTLTLEQFMHIGGSPRPSSPKDQTQEPNSKDKPQERGRKGRSMSLSDRRKEDPIAQDLSERIKHTRGYKKKGFQANSRGSFVQAPFTTLEEMFKKLPESIGFNIEMKYPMLFESEEQEMDTYAVEINSFVDTVLTTVYDFGKNQKSRPIIFSSFNPDVCLLLSFKQPSIPVLFLTDAGTSPVADIRASCLQEAIRFASRWNLLGIVSQAEPFTICPRLVKVVKESGLVCVSYGTLNNDPEKVRLQVEEGIDAVIVDSVLKIRQGLTEREKLSSPQSPGSPEAVEAKGDVPTLRVDAASASTDTVIGKLEKAVAEASLSNGD